MLEPTDEEFAGQYRDDPENENVDYYENQPGEAISGKQLRFRRRKMTGLVLVAVGTVLILIGIVAALRSGDDGVDQSSDRQKLDRTNDGPLPLTASPIIPSIDPPSLSDPVAETPAPSQAVVVDAGLTDAPVESPTVAPVVDTPVVAPTDAPVVPPTEAPTAAPVTPDVELQTFLKGLLGDDAFDDQTSVAYKTFEWLASEAKLPAYDDVQRKQRFALGSVYFATNHNNTWTDTHKWISEEGECNWFGVRCNDDKYLVGLNLTDNGLEGTIPGDISLLSESLLVLELANNKIHNDNPEDLVWIEQLLNLRALELQETSLKSDGIPTYIGALTDLRILDVSNTEFHGKLHGSTFSPLHKLEFLEMGGNKYSSKMPHHIAKLPELRALYIKDSHLTGDLDFLGLFPKIFELWIDGNPDLVGSIPTTIGTLDGLASLSLTGCGITGSIPTEFGMLANLKQAWLFGNNIEGEVPTQIGNLKNLHILQLEDNDLITGSMPSAICNLWNITVDGVMFGDGANDGSLVAMGADCAAGDQFQCDCCSCCEAPCPIVGIDYGSRRRRLHARH